MTYRLWESPHWLAGALRRHRAVVRASPSLFGSWMGPPHGSPLGCRESAPAGGDFSLLRQRTCRSDVKKPPRRLGYRCEQLRRSARSLGRRKLMKGFQQSSNLIVFAIEIRQRYAKSARDQPRRCNRWLVNAQLISADPRPTAGLIDADEYAYLLLRPAQRLSPCAHSSPDNSCR